MKLSKGQQRQIRDGIEKLKELATLKNANFNDEEKAKIRVWATWIDVYATQIEQAMNNYLWNGFYYDE